MNNFDGQSELTLSGKVWLASDIHLGASIPLTGEAFYRFLQKAMHQADHLILVGDIFDAWIGDDIAIKHPQAWLSQAIKQLQLFSQQKPLYIITGNRDFLIKHNFCTLIGATLLPLATKVHTDAGLILLSHGDEYCTDDKGFMLMRRVFHSRLIQKLFLNLPLKWRLKIAYQARNASKNTQKKSIIPYKDIDEKSIIRAFNQSPDLTAIIHGHTHMPNVHEYAIGQTIKKRYVLPDWDYDCTKPRGGYIKISSSGVELIKEP